MKRILVYLFLLIIFFVFIGIMPFNSQILLIINWLIPLLIVILLIWEILALKLKLQKTPIVFNFFIIICLILVVLFSAKRNIKSIVPNITKKEAPITKPDTTGYNTRKLIYGEKSLVDNYPKAKKVKLPKTADFIINTEEAYKKFSNETIYVKDFDKHIGKTVLIKSMYHHTKRHFKNQALLGWNVRLANHSTGLLFSFWAEFPKDFKYRNNYWVEVFATIDKKETSQGVMPILIVKKVNKIKGPIPSKTGCSHNH